MSENPVQVARAQIDAVTGAQATITAPGYTDPPSHAPVKFDRLSLERRVLAFITEGESPPMGPRNTLAALSYDLMRDRNTTHPPAPNGRLEVVGKTTEEIVQQIADCLDALEAEGLVNQRADGSYKVTKAGEQELSV